MTKTAEVHPYVLKKDSFVTDSFYSLISLIVGNVGKRPFFRRKLFNLDKPTLNYRNRK